MGPHRAAMNHCRHGEDQCFPAQSGLLRNAGGFNSLGSGWTNSAIDARGSVIQKGTPS